MRRLARLSLFAAAMVLSLWLFGCAPKGEPPQPTPTTPGVADKPPVAPPGTQTASVGIVGDIHAVLDGAITETSFVELKPADIIAAIGAGSFGSKDRTGDMFVFGDRAYVRVPDEAEGVPTMSNAMGVKAAFAVGIAQGERPADLVHRATGQAQTVEEMLKDLIAQYRVPVAVYGIGEFLSVRGTAVKRAPVEGENIQSEQMREKYFLPVIEKDHEVMVFFGVAASDAARPWTPAKDLFERAIYANFANQTEGGVGYHLHGAVIEAVDQDPATLDFRSFFAAARKATAKEIFHLLGQSEIQNGTILVYALSKVAREPMIRIHVEGGVGVLVPALR